MKSTNRIIEISKARAFHFQSMNFANATKQGIKALEPTIVYHPGNFYIALMEIGTTSYFALGVAKFDTTREPDTTRYEISRLWVKA